MSFAKIAGDNPFLLWLLLVNNSEPVDIKTNSKTGAKDIMLGVLGSRRFGFASVDGLPYLGYVEPDRAALESVKWTAAAMLFSRQGGDWIALSSSDARTDMTQSMNPVPLRLFIPVSTGRLSAWKELGPKELAIGHMTPNKNGEALMPASPFRKLPLKVS